MPSPGESFGRYELEALLGKGGMGQVFRANDTVLRRRVALKLVLDAPGESTDTEGRARLLREARAAAAIEHANVIHVYDVGEHDGVLFIAMELIDGVSLRQRLASNPPATQAELIGWLSEVGKALAAAHDLGLVHRDVKPDNVMIRKDGRATMLDFGIARRTSASADDHLGRLTGEGVVTGTPLYMAPEHLRGEAVDGRSDQFAWGVMAYECLVGELPWGPIADGVQLISSVLTKEATPMPSSVPPAVAAAVMRALAKDPSARFPTMHDVVAALTATPAAPFAPTEKAPITPPPRVGNEEIALARTEHADAPRKRTRWPFAVVTLVVFVAAGGWVMHAKTKAPPVVAPEAAPTGIMALPLPRSANPVAVSTYKAGIQSLHDADYQLALQSFTRAAELDPGMALAHLRIVLIRISNMATPDAVGMRAEYAKAFSLRTDLEPRDRDLLDALEPAMHDVPIWEDVARRVEGVRDTYPLDAELWSLSGYFRWLAGDVDPSLVATRRATDLDPTYADAWQAVASSTITSGGDLGVARGALDRCLVISPRSRDCLRDRASLDDDRGDCAAMEADAKAGDFQDQRVAAMYARHATPEAIDEVLAAPPTSGYRTAAELRARLAFVTGDFPAAEAAMRNTLTAATGDPNLEVHARPTRMLVQILVESGRTEEAAKITADYLRRKDSWLGPPNAATAELLAIARGHGDIDETQWKVEMTKLDRQGLLSSHRDVGEFWAITHAYVEDEASARAAVAELDALGPHPFAYDRNLEIYQGQAGRLLVLAGRRDEGLALLVKATTRCQGLLFPYEQTRSWLWLGRALESTDVTGACDAYRVVVERWGNAKPRSVSADEARARQKLLSCR